MNFCKQGRVEAVGSFEELNKSGFDIAKTLEEDEESDLDPDYAGRSISESDLEVSLSRHGSVSISGRHRRGSSGSKTSLKEVPHHETNIP